MSNKYRCKYEYECRFGQPFHQWSLVAADGGLHLHITDLGIKHEEKYHERYSGGIEVHWRSPPDYMKDKPPSHDECWLLKCPCWHDGSSLQVSEFWIPKWLALKGDQDAMFELLESDMSNRFGEVDDSAERVEQP